jgi:hypothetical protein
MKMHHTTSAGGHVGRGLKACMWRELFPAVFAARTDGGDGGDGRVRFIGAGKFALPSGALS